MTQDVERVVQLLGPSAGGIRVHVATLAAGLRDRGVESPVLGPAAVMNGIGPQAGVVRVPDGVNPLGLLQARRDLAPWRRDAQIVHAHGLKAAWTAVRGSPRRPVAVTVHNMVLTEAAGAMAPLQRLLQRRVLARADRVIVLTSSMQRELAGFVAPERIRVALPAAPAPEVLEDRSTVRSRLGVGANVPLVVCVARLHPQKDLPTLLLAWQVVHARAPDAVLVIVGDGPQRRELEDLRVHLGLESSVKLAGRRPHAVDEIAAADVVVMTSIWEGAALVLAETTQLGIPMVSTPTGLAPDLLDGEVGGTIVSFGDHDGVADALCNMLDDPGAAAEMGRRGRERARALFDPSRAIEEIMDVYRELLS